MNYPNKYISIFHIVLLAIICFMIFFSNMSSYPFIDTDETKFVSIAKEMLNYSDWINVKLNGENIYTIPPFFFWITNLFCVLIGKISIVTMRMPISIISLAGVLILYSELKKILTQTYASIITLIFTTCLGILIFSRLATNDMMSLIIFMVTILLSYKVIFTENEKNTIFYWLLIYSLSAISVLCSGLFGFAIIFISILTMHIFAGKLKELFHPKNFLSGIITFLILLCPWFVIMIYKHKLMFIKEYLSIYNFIKYIGIKEFLNVIGLFVISFSPWIFSFLWILGKKSKDIFNSIFSYFKDNSQDKLKEKWKKLKKIDKFASLNTIVFFTSFIFALLYGYKYTYLILFMIFPAACISGKYWYEYIIKHQHGKSIFFATIIPNLILIICSLLGLFGHNILNEWIFQGFSNLLIPLIIIFFVIPVISIFAVILKGRIVPFVANIILMVSLSFVITPSIFNFIAANGGENDLINFAQIAKNDNVKLAAFISSKKHSILYYYDKPVEFLGNSDFEQLKIFLEENPFAYVIVAIKDMSEIEAHEIKYMLLDSGKRYCLIQYMSYDVEMYEDTTEPEIIVY
ncbi:glycosyltransferase family 39 protein [bacterium]|nr:glycosyltransferase family 39 protein [bacterium]